MNPVKIRIKKRRQLYIVWRSLFLLLIVLITCGCDQGVRDTEKPDIKSGHKAFKERSYNQAIKDWSQALRAEPNNMKIAFKLAVAFQNKGRLDESIRLLMQIISKADAPIDAYILLIQNLILSRDINEVENVIKIINKRKLNDYKLLTIDGDFKTLTGRLSEGEKLYLKAIKRHPENADSYFKLAANLVVQKEIENAHKYYKHALCLGNEKSAKFWLHKAEFLTLTGQTDDAEVALQEALKREPKSQFVKIKIAQLYKAMNKYDAILDLFKDKEIVPESDETKKIVVEALLNINDIEAAYSALMKRQHSIDDDWLVLWGKYYLLVGDATSAVSSLAMANEQKPRDTNILYMLALGYLAGNKFNLAQRTLIQLLTFNPDFSDAELALADIYYKKENYNLSIEYLNRSIAKNPDNFRSYLILGNCFLSLGRFEKAELNFRKALKLNDNSVDALYFLSVTKEKIRDDNSAIHMIRQILERSPEKIDAILKLAEIYVRRNTPEDAICTVGQLVDDYPENAYLRIILGNVYRSIGDPVNALIFYQKALEIDPKLDAGYINIASIERDSHKKIKLLRKATKNLPKSVKIKTLLAGIYLEEGEIQKAIEIGEELYSGNRCNPFFANNLAWLYLEKKVNLIQAFEMATDAYETDNGNACFAHTLGVAYHRKGLLKQAEWYLKQSVALIEQSSHKNKEANNEGVYYYDLALVLVNRGKQIEAKKFLKLAKKKGFPKRYAESSFGPADNGGLDAN
jgi:tetratricopeptide (TPR) repeat protein